MSHLKRGLAALLLASAALTSTPARAGVPTVDLVAIAADALAWIEQFTHMVDQIKQMKAQYEQMKNTADALKGGRGMGVLLSDPSVRQSLDPDFLSTMDRLRTLGAAGASAKARAVYDAVSSFKCSEQFPGDVELRKRCETRAMAVPAMVATLNQSLERAQSRVTALQSLITQVDAAPDAKAAADLQNRISAEVALLSNERAMMDTATKQLESSAQVNAEAARQAGLKRVMQEGKNPFSKPRL